jgi:hypothetical protein
VILAIFGGVLVGALLLSGHPWIALLTTIAVIVACSRDES